MIRCSNCGTINRDGRRSCRECGKALPQTKLRCPECGTLNPVGNLFCDQCNARLISPEDVVPSEAESKDDADAPPVMGISLPTRSVEGDDLEEASLPDWLRELADDETGVPTSPVQPSSPEPADDGTDAEAGYPDWISGLVDEESFEEDASEETPDPDTFSLDNDDLPDWLRDTEESGEPAGPAVEEPAEASPEEAETFSLDDEDLPDWLRDIEEPAAPSYAAPSPEPRVNQEERGSAAESGTNLPDWLRAHADPSLAEGRAPTDQALPEWLTERVEEPSASAAPSSQPLPDWLQPTANPPADRQEEEAAEEFTPAPEESGDEEAGAFEPAETAPAPDFDSGGLPDWLSEEFEEIEPQPGTRPTASETTEAEEADLPDWLTAIGEDFEEEAEPAVEAPQPRSEPDFEPQAEPQAVSEPTGAEHPDEAEEVPDWLADIEMTDEIDVEAATEVFAEEPDSERSLKARGGAIPDEVPDWLRDVAPAGRAPGPQQETPALIDSGDADEEPETPEPEVAEPEEVPDWLRDLEPSDVEAPERSAPLSAEAEEARPARARLPAWMQGLRPPNSAGGDEDISPFTEAAEAEGLVPAEIPEWVRALRPELETGGPDTPRSERIQKTASMEMEGPLASLRGVLNETAIVDLPTDTDVRLSAAIPEDVREQAELWQQLLSRPRSVKRSVAQAKQQRGTGAIAVRILLTAVLFLGALAGLWFLSPAMRVSQTPSPRNAPGVGMLWNQLEQLQAGDTVLVVTEYGPAYADEMNAMAEALLEHLQDREVDLKLVSTLPEGTGLSHAAVMAVYGNDDAVLQRTYLVNQLPGVASYLQSPDAQEAEHVVILASRPARVRWWIEQNAALQGADGAAPLPVSVAASASVGPMIAPYLEGTAVEGWLIGLPQTLAYREVRGFDNASYGGIPDVLMVTHWIVAAFLLFGLLYHLALGKKGAG